MIFYIPIMILPLIGCETEQIGERIPFVKNDRNGMIRSQSFLHGRMETGKDRKTYSFFLKQAENVQGIFQIDSIDPELRIRLIKTGYPLGSKTDCTNTNSGNTYSCRIEIPALEKGKYKLSVFRGLADRESDFNLFAGIFGKGYVDIE
ncbi:LIC_10463 family lipoprotein [Leptospira ellisii]